MPWGINPNFSGLFPCGRQVAYALRTRAPVSRMQAPSTPRLACVRPAASVHPEPGSNSPLYRRSLKLFCSLAQGLSCAIFPKKIYLKTSVSLYACFPVLSFSVPSRQRTRGLPSACIVHPRPPPVACITSSSLSFTPSLRFGSAKVATFSFPPTLSPKKFFLFFSPFNLPQNVAIPSKRVQI